MTNDISLIYIFSTNLQADSFEAGKKSFKPTAKACKDFASSWGLLLHMDSVGVFDGVMTIRIMLEVQGPKNAVLEQVSAIFAFAAFRKFTLVNQFILSKEEGTSPK